MVLRSGGDLLTGRPDVLDGGVQVAQLGCDGPLVHCAHGNTGASPTFIFVIIKVDQEVKGILVNPTFSSKRHRQKLSGEVQQLGEVLAQRLGQDVEKGGLSIHGFCCAQLGDVQKRSKFKLKLKRG